MFIATQGPIDGSIEDFWQMVFDNKVGLIVMLCSLAEGGRQKCAEYWKENNTKITFKIKVTEEKSVNEYLMSRVFLVTDKNGEVISKWTSVVSENHKVTVKPGTYTLHEDLSPVGYKIAKDITFDVDIEGKVTVNGKKVDQVVMVDEDQTYDIAISKQDITNNKELPGAKLSLKDTKTNKVVETWTSASEAHVVTVVPSTYELSEVAAPNGYEIAEKITFTVERDGTITIDGKKVETVIMQDQPTKPTVDTSDHNNIVFFGITGVISLGLAFMMLLTRKKIH